MDAFFAYIKTIIGFLIFMTFTEILLPGGPWKKYCSLLTGLCLIALVLGPLGTLSGQGLSAEMPHTEISVRQISPVGEGNAFSPGKITVGKE